MEDVRSVEIFTADCPVCDDAIQMVRKIACDSCDVTVLDLNDGAVAQRAAELGVRSVPAVAVGGELAACCTDRAVDEAALRAEGIGRPLN